MPHGGNCHGEYPQKTVGRASRETADGDCSAAFRGGNRAPASLVSARGNFPSGMAKNCAEKLLFHRKCKNECRRYFHLVILSVNRFLCGGYATSAFHIGSPAASYLLCGFFRGKTSSAWVGFDRLPLRMSSRGEASFARISPRRAAFPEKHGKPGGLKSHSGKFSFSGGLVLCTERRTAPSGICAERGSIPPRSGTGATAAECFPERGRQDEKQKGR